LPQNPQKNDQIQVLAMRALGPRRSIHLLQVDGHRLLVGSTDTKISLLRDLGSPPSGGQS
jgi:flagellar biogenesis protein FliO